MVLPSTAVFFHLPWRKISGNNNNNNNLIYIAPACRMTSEALEYHKGDGTGTAQH